MDIIDIIPLTSYTFHCFEHPNCIIDTLHSLKGAKTVAINKIGALSSADLINHVCRCCPLKDFILYKLITGKMVNNN